MTENPLWDLIQRYMDHPGHRYSPRAADIARETGVSDQLLSKWKKAPTLPEPEQLRRIAVGTGIPYPRLLEAALRGKGYIQAGVRLVTARAIDPDLEAHFKAQDDRGYISDAEPYLRRVEAEPNRVTTDTDAGPLTPEQQPQPADDPRP